MVSDLINANPVVYERRDRRDRNTVNNVDEYVGEPIDQQEIFVVVGYFLSFFACYTYGHTMMDRDNVVIVPFDMVYESLCKLDIKDPEHPYSLEELKVITEDAIEVDDNRSYVRVTFTPTVEHCSLAAVIGLCLRVKLMRCLPSRYKVDIRVAPGSHATEAAVNKQLNDKERVAAALESPNLLDMVDECLAPSFAS